jgi:hypothetical protein
VGQGAPGGNEAGPGGDDQEHGQPPHALDQPPEQLERGRVGPVDVLEDEEKRPVRQAA